MKKEIKAYVSDYALNNILKEEDLGALIGSDINLNIVPYSFACYKHEITITFNEPLTFDYIKKHCKNGDIFKDEDGDEMYFIGFTKKGEIAFDYNGSITLRYKEHQIANWELLKSEDE